jgi:uncharacterized membrane protein required for colicin V production
VPRIDTPLLLDVLLGLVVLLFVPFGIRRGVAKEAMVSASILLGAILAERFGGLLGAELTARFGLEPGAAMFAASVAILFSSTVLLGYGGGAALGVVRPGTLARLVGGLLAAFNAALLLSYLLRWIDGYLAQGAALDDGLISRSLLRESDWLLLGAAGVLLGLTVLGWIINAGRSRRQPRAADNAFLGGMPARQRPVRVATTDEGKFDPDQEPAPRSGRFGPGLDATSPLPAAAGRWSGESPATLTTNGHSRTDEPATIWRRPTGSATGGEDDTVWAVWSGQPGDDPRVRAETTPPWPVATSPGITDDDRCAVCRARVGPRDVFCPECGATL